MRPEAFQKIKQFFLKSGNVYGSASQILFFTVTAKVSEQDNNKYVVAALTTLLFYTVISYFVTKTIDIATGNQVKWRSNYPSWIKGICKIVLEWLKAVVIVVCLREQGMHIEFNKFYLIITFFYYLCTDAIFQTLFTNILEFFEFDFMESLERYLLPFWLKSCATLASVIVFTEYLLLNFKLTTFLIFIPIYVQIGDIYCNYWTIIKEERKIISNYRDATKEQLKNLDDVCAICLCNLKKAKITPCKHYFHGPCLRRSIKYSNLCPICLIPIK